MAAREMLYELIESMQGHGWHEEEIYDVLGRRTLKPKSFPLSGMYSTAHLYSLWLYVHVGLIPPRESDLFDDIERMTQGAKARVRERRAWRDERVRVGGVHSGHIPYGPRAGDAAVVVRMGGCNLRCEDCQHRETWDGGQTMTVPSLEGQIARAGEHYAMYLTGGEPALWQDRGPFLDMLYRYRASTRAIHLQTNGTMPVRKLFRDVATTTLVVADPAATDEMDWDALRERWEAQTAPFWAPVLSPANHATLPRILETVEPDRIFPIVRRPEHHEAAERLSRDLGWHPLKPP